MLPFDPYTSVLFLFLSSLRYGTSFRPPHSTLAYHERTRDVKGMMEHNSIQQLVLFLLSVPLPLIAGIESILILSQQWSPTSPINIVLHKLLFYNDSNASSLHVTPIRIIGVVMMLTGALVRLSCYRALRKFFSVRVGIHRDHKLVTAFPYSIVRHPSYAALAISQLGALYAHFTPGSWIIESGVTDDWIGNVVLGLYASFLILFYVVESARAKEEDRVLKSHFREEWEAWAREVRYRLIPGLY